MATAIQVRVIFYYSSTSEFQTKIGIHRSSEPEIRAFNKALELGERLLRNGLAAVFTEVVYLTVVQCAVKLSSPQGLLSLVGKTIIVVNPSEEDLLEFLDWYSKPDGSEEIGVKFEKAVLDNDLHLVVEPIRLCQDDGENSED